MVSKREFTDQIGEAYDHLYDIVHLRTHPLTNILVADPHLSLKDKAWRCHHLLLNVIEELDPGPQAPIFSRAWRRHRLMVLHHIDGLEPQVVADELAISRRHYYREYKETLKAIASILWNRYVVKPQKTPETASEQPDQGDLDRLALLRTEAARLNQANRYTRLAEVVPGVVQLVTEMARQNEVQIQVSLRDNSPRLSMDQHILRQILLGLLNYLLGPVRRCELRVTDVWQAENVRLIFRLRGVANQLNIPQDDVQFAMLKELAAIQKAHINLAVDEYGQEGFDLILPTLPPQTVLVVDDNTDTLELFRRYLQPHQFQVATAQTGAEVLNLARTLQPQAIILDLMLPDRDGWDILQTLTHQPETHHIPIIICTVLSTKQLALSLGAAAFLEKPVTEEALLTTLAGLEAAE